MTSAPVLTFRAKVSIGDRSADKVVLATPFGELPLGELTAGVVDGIDRLAGAGATEDELEDLVLSQDGPDALAAWFYILGLLRRLAFVQYSVVATGGPVATVEPMTQDFDATFGALDPAARYRLSRFACMRRDGDSLVLESPLAPARVALLAPSAATIIATLATPTTVAELGHRDLGISGPDLELLLVLLHAAGVVETDGNHESTALRQWEFHDLLFHARSRAGRHDNPFGGTFPFLDEISPLPAIKPSASSDVLALPRPDIEELVRDDVPFTRVLEGRRSVRDYAQPLTVAQLSEFLFRVAHVRHVTEVDPERGFLYEVSSRPYPSGGASYDLELYITANQCADLARGIYHYDPLGHRLSRIADWSEEAEILVADARGSAGMSDEPQVLITLAARFQRLQWKYRSMAYATTLKNAGVLYQTMYLVATAMGLAPCGLGGGDADLFARAAGTDYYAESSVGEFLLGTVGPSSGAPEPA